MNPTTTQPHVVIVGGGIAGLAAAFFLRDEPVRVTVLEGSPRLGGKLSVSEVGGVAVDEGAEALLVTRPEGTGLIADLGNIASASRVLMDLQADPITNEPVARRQALAHAAEILGGEADWRQWVLTGGDDHALVATFPAGLTLPPRWTVIGRVTQGQGIVVDGRRWLGAGGWEHFST